MSAFSSILERLVFIEENNVNGNHRDRIVNDNRERSHSVSSNECDIDFITFTCQWDKVPISIMIEDKITCASLMKDVLLQNVGEDPSINDEFQLDIDSGDKLYFKLKITNGSIILKNHNF